MWIGEESSTSTCSRESTWISSFSFFLFSKMHFIIKLALNLTKKKKKRTCSKMEKPRVNIQKYHALNKKKEKKKSIPNHLTTNSNQILKKSILHLYHYLIFFKPRLMSFTPIPSLTILVRSSFYHKITICLICIILCK